MGGPTETSDAELMRQSLKRPAMFRAVYERHVASVHRWLRSKVDDEQIARELTAETFAQALASRRRFVAPADGSAAQWLFGIAHNLELAWHRKQSVESRSRSRLGIELTTLHSAVDPALAEIELDGYRPDVLKALDRLPVEQRKAIELRVVEQLPYAEVAARLECTQNAAKKRVAKALRLMANELEAHGS